LVTSGSNNLLVMASTARMPVSISTISARLCYELVERRARLGRRPFRGRRNSVRA
jgi:hypothetical protein